MLNHKLNDCAYKMKSYNLTLLGCMSCVGPTLHTAHLNRMGITLSPNAN